MFDAMLEHPKNDDARTGRSRPTTFNTTVCSTEQQAQFCELQNADPHLSSDPSPPDLSAEPSDPNPAEELACNIDELANESEYFANEASKEAAWEAGV